MLLKPVPVEMLVELLYCIDSDWLRPRLRCRPCTLLTTLLVVTPVIAVFELFLLAEELVELTDDTLVLLLADLPKLFEYP